MKKIILPLILITTYMSTKAQTFEYPKTKKANQVDYYGDVKVLDPYRWLENDTAQDTKEWVKEQNQVTNDYLNKCTFKDILKSRIVQLNNYPKYSSPMKAGNFYFYYKNDGLQNQSVLYYQRGLEERPEVFLDPNTYSDKGTVSINIAGISHDDKYIAFTIQKAGSDWQEIFVMDIVTKQTLKDKIEWVKFSGASWYKDGFYYSRYDKPLKGMEFSSQNKNHKIYFHKLGTPQSKDQLIYTDASNPLRYFGATVSEDERYLFVNISQGTYGTELMYRDLRVPNSPLKLLFKGFEHEYEIIDNVEDKLLVLTNNGAPNRKIVLVDPKIPIKTNWKVIVKEKNELIEGASTGGGKLFVNYLKDCSSKIFHCNLDGTEMNEVQLPGIGSAGGLGGKKTERILFYTYTSFNTPPVIYSYDVASGKSNIFRAPETKFRTEDFITTQVFYPSKDGTKVPMFIVHKRGLEMNGKNPTLLYGYGGFNVNLTPSFSASRIAFLEQGGIYVMANIRGGGEYGEAWHKAGMLNKKQNVFDDFIAAAEYLIANKYTSSEKLAISGGSNGGLLVGACLTQRPDLFKVAFPAVGVLDMLRFHKFTVGWGWVVEYGSSDVKEQFDYLYKYSPYHQVKSGTKYPAVLVTTGDHDDRVVPAHSFKFISALQEANASSNPVMIRIETDAGHGAGKPMSKAIDEIVDVYCFMLMNMGYTELRDQR
jgi:prolyl oligopeptidase